MINVFVLCFQSLTSPNCLFSSPENSGVLNPFDSSFSPLIFHRKEKLSSSLPPNFILFQRKSASKYGFKKKFQVKKKFQYQNMTYII
ncbi:hypothetical protein Aconfl_12140 [Algoriphagus confluentis]|uniref:Uncharacterized protein n=1 Tax=Algoriphagus confluentis TaxID=1697556 RepID=A0ABQ6PKX7_9BACT|nr:hypothetical protein Aconfl_12140 [Algoriphagus confluentis]